MKWSEKVSFIRSSKKKKKHFCYYKKRMGSAMGRGDGMCVMEKWRKKWLNCWGDFLHIFKFQQSLPSCIFFSEVITLECLYKIRTVYFFTFKIILKLGHAIQKNGEESNSLPYFHHSNVVTFICTYKFFVCKT